MDQLDNQSKHSWIDLAVFEDWFTSHLLPVLKKHDGKKLIIGDNLTFHLSVNVVKLYEENNIHFVCLPPNLTQPLEVIFCRLLKSKWRDVLGIFPLNRDEFLNHLPRQDRSVNLDLVGNAFIAHLEQKRNDLVKNHSTKEKKI